MSIYKKICSETGRVYFGSTKNNIKVRENKGHYNCTCKDFINPIIVVIEDASNLTKKERLKRERYYIENFSCVNRNIPTRTPKETRQATYLKNKEKRIEDTKRFYKKVINEKRFYCGLCDLSFSAPGKLKRHIDGYRHQLKTECFNKFGDSWKDNYKKFKRLKQEETRKKKNSPQIG